MKTIPAMLLAAAMPFAMMTTEPLTQADEGVVVLAKITKTNGGGKTPAGNANGVPSTNPTGKAPPGQSRLERPDRGSTWLP